MVVGSTYRVGPQMKATDNMIALGCSVFASSFYFTTEIILMPEFLWMFVLIFASIVIG